MQLISEVQDTAYILQNFAFQPVFVATQSKNCSINLHTQQIKTYDFLLVAIHTVCNLTLEKSLDFSLQGSIEMGIKSPRPFLWYCYFGAPSLIQPVFVGIRSDLPILVAALLSLLCHNVLNYFLEDFSFFISLVFSRTAKICEMNQSYF